MGRWNGWMGWLLVALTMFAAPVWAQTTSNILGTAEDANGAPVAGIKVVLGGEALIGGARETLTATDGSFRFIGLLPGGYTVTATAEGFRPFASGDVYLSLGETMDLTALMEVKTGEDVITTTAPAPAVDMKKVTMGQTLSRSELKNLPLPRRSYQQATRFVAGVDPDAGGGNPSIHGSSTYSNAYLIDGVNTTDPSTNTFSLNFNYDAICDIEVQTGTISPEYGNVTGGVINLVTCGGSNEHHFDTSYYYSSKDLTMEDRSGEKRDASEETFNVNAGGPIIQDKLWYYASMQYLKTQSQIAKLPGQPAHPPEDSEGFYWLAKLTGAPDTHNRFTLLFQGDPRYFNNTLQDPTVSKEAEGHQDQGGMLASLRWDGLYDPFVAKVQLAYKSTFLDIFPQARAKSSSAFNFGNSLTEKNDFGVTSGCLVGPDGVNYCGATASDVQDSPEFGNGLHYNLDTGESTVGDSSDFFIIRERTQGTASVSRFLDSSFGKHEIKAGVDTAFMVDTQTDRYPGGATAFIEFDQDGDGVADPYSARLVASDKGALTQVVEGNVMAFFALDNWDIQDRIRLQPGVRVEQARYDNYEGKTVLNFNTVAPRFGFSADAFGDKQTRIHGGYGQLYETGNLALAQFVGTSLTSHRTYYESELSGDLNGDGIISNRYYEDPDNQSIRGGASGRRVDKNLQPMRTDEYQVGIEQALSDDASVDLTYIRRDTVNAWEDRGVGQIWNQAGTAVVGSEDGSFSQVFEVATIDGAERKYEAFELSLNKQFANNWSMAGSYTLSWLEGSTVELLTGDFDNPRQDAYGYGPLADDHRNVIKMQGAYLFPVGLSVGAAYEFESGAPYSKLFLNDEDGGYSNRRSPRGTDPGIDPNDPSDDQALTLPDYTNISLHAGYSLKKLTGQDLEFVANINNLLNLQAVTGLENSDVEGYGLPNAYQRPFTAQLGVTYSY